MVNTTTKKFTTSCHLALLFFVLGIHRTQSLTIPFLSKTTRRKQTFQLRSATLPPTRLGEYTTDLQQDELEQRIQGITAIASDVDGTLLSKDHTLSNTTRQAIIQAVQEAARNNSHNDNGKLQHFFVATGKTHKGALDSLGPEMRELLSNLPGVFCQGLYCVDGRGNVIFERKLPSNAIAASEQLAAKFDTTLIGNSEDTIYCNAVGDSKLLSEVNSKWGEPKPTMIPSLTNDGPQFHKMVLMSNDVALLRDKIRPELELLAKNNGATVTTSHPTILEILPAGCSKAVGVQMVCEHLKIDPYTQLLAMGDAENDKGMLEMAAIGVAVGNGCPVAKAAADIVLEQHSCDGAAGLAMQHFSPLRDL